MRYRLYATTMILSIFVSTMTNAVYAQQSVSQPFTITVTVTPALASIGLSNTTVNTVGPVNHGALVGAVVVTTNPPGGNTANVTLSKSGADAGKFVFSSTTLPSNLLIGPTDLVGGTYNITLTASTP